MTTDVRRAGSVLVPRELLGLAITGLIVVVALIPALRLTDADLRVPFNYDSRGDAMFYSMTVKTIVDGGGVLSTPELGAPAGLDLRDFPLGADNLNFATIRVLGLFSGDWALVINAFYLLTFPLAALTAALVLRALGASWPATIAAAVLFAFAPFHFRRNESQLMLSAYYGVPLGCWLVLEALRRAERNGQTTGDDPPAKRRVLAVARVVAVLVIGSTGIYFASFTVALLLVAAAVALLRRAGWRVVASQLLTIAAIIGMLLVNLLPSIVYWLDHGANTTAVARAPAESERLGLRFADLVLPVPGHRLSPLASLRNDYGESLRQAYNTTWGEPAELGSVAACGFLALLAIVVVSAVGRRTQWSGERYRHLGVAALAAFVIGVAGGAGSVFALVVTAELRGWNRISIFISFFALAAVALAVDWAARHIATRWPSITPQRATVALAAGVLVVGLVDQVSPLYQPRHVLSAERYHADRGFVQSIEAALPAMADLVSLPYLRFPEAVPPGTMKDYDHLAGYLHSNDLRWSYGAMKGRPDDWANALADHPAPVVATAAAAAGFEGIYVDRAGYSDGGAAIDSELRAATGVDPSSGVDGRLLFFDLRDYHERLIVTEGEAQLADVRELVLNPVAVDFRTGFHALEHDSEDSWRWARNGATVVLHNPLRDARRVVVEYWIATADPEGRAVTVKYPGGARDHWAEIVDRETVRRSVELRPGDNKLSFTTSRPEVQPTGDPRLLALRVGDLLVTDVVLADLATPEAESPEPAGGEEQQPARE